MAKRQASLVEWWSLGGSGKKGRVSSETDSADAVGLASHGSVGVGDDSPTSSCEPPSDQEPTVSLGPSSDEEESEGEQSVSNCTALCCTSSDKAHQPTDKQVLAQLASKGRNFQT